MRTLSSHRSYGSHLISGTYYFCERREYAFNVLPEYLIIFLKAHAIILFIDKLCAHPVDVQFKKWDWQGNEL
jgi:hypothetical protein